MFGVIEHRVARVRDYGCVVVRKTGKLVHCIGTGRMSCECVCVCVCACACVHVYV